MAHHNDQNEHTEHTEHHDVPHRATEHDAGTGQGTVSDLPEGVTQDRPVLDGSTESDAAERATVNPRRGMQDPGLVRNTDTGETTPTPEDY